MDRADPDLLPEGLSDRLPPRAAAAARVRRAMEDAIAAHGYRRVQPPLVEFERSLTSRVAGIDHHRLVRFTDPASLRTLALRSDMTVQVGRIATTGLADEARPLRLSYSGQVVALRGATLQPERERLQIGAEIVGTDTVEAASESVMVAIDAVRAGGATDISVDFTLPDLVDTLSAGAFPLDDDAIDPVRRELDAKDAGGLVAAGGEAYLPLLYAGGPFDNAIARLSEIDAGGVLSTRIEGLQQIASRIGHVARLTLDPSERHGFEYQSWFGFTIYADGLRGALGRGGTYRIACNGNRAGEAATGFSLYPDPLIAASVEVRRDKLFLPVDHDRGEAQRLRAIGWVTVAALSDEDEAEALGCSHRLGADGPQPV